MGEEKSSFEMFKEIVQGQLDKLRVINQRQWERIQGLLKENGELELKVIQLQTELVNANRYNTKSELVTREDTDRDGIESTPVVLKQKSRGRTKTKSVVSRNSKGSKSKPKTTNEEESLTEDALQKLTSNGDVIKNTSASRDTGTFIVDE